ncbi:hypothetical protein SCUCBS95973_007963 [Sporothrix curviconia]|uniref:Uncharacterized protein n=1 Tax=Sporothrix curviconia TaxID=1260050 RepID=A0ABP0CI09_9PEZI
MGEPCKGEKVADELQKSDEVKPEAPAPDGTVQISDSKQGIVDEKRSHDGTQKGNSQVGTDTHKTDEALHDRSEAKTDLCRTRNASENVSLPDDDPRSKLEQFIRRGTQSTAVTYLESAEELLHSLYYDGPRSGIHVNAAAVLASVLTTEHKQMAQKRRDCRRTQNDGTGQQADRVSLFDDVLYCPQRLRPWLEFEKDHAETLLEMLTALDGEEPSKHDNVGGAGDADNTMTTASLSDTREKMLKSARKGSLDVCKFSQTCIQEPAAAIVRRYLRANASQAAGGPLSVKWYTKNEFGLEAENRLENYHHYQVVDDLRDRLGAPHAWGLARRGARGDFYEHSWPVWVARYNTTTGRTMRGLRSMAQRGWDESAIAQSTRRAVDGEDPTRPACTPPQPHRAIQALCQQFHFMITTGVEYAFISSGSSILFLRVPADDWRMLQYHFCDFPVPSIRDVEARQNMNKGVRMAHQTAVAYLASFWLRAARTTPRSASWINAAEADIKYWPRWFENGAACNEDEGYANGKNERLKLLAVEPPTLPYCTQACLLGLKHQKALDDQCPNVDLHRGAAAAKGHDGSRHPMTVPLLGEVVKAQLLASVNRDCECLDKDGCYGRHGVLFRITATGYGYTFVAKGVRGWHLHVLDHEQNMYNGVEAVQGRLIPVFLGLVTLARGIPLPTHVLVRHLMLLSYAGPDLERLEKAPDPSLPSIEELDRGVKRTGQELFKAGLVNPGVRRPNTAWNAEVGRVMHLDLFRAQLMYSRCFDTAPTAKRDHDAFLKDADKDGMDTGANVAGGQGVQGAGAEKRPKTDAVGQQSAFVGDEQAPKAGEAGQEGQEGDMAKVDEKDKGSTEEKLGNTDEPMTV